MGKFDDKLQELVLKENGRLLFFIADENYKLLSEKGYRNKSLAEKFFVDFRFSSQERLKLVRLEVDENGKIIKPKNRKLMKIDKNDKKIRHKDRKVMEVKI